MTKPSKGLLAKMLKFRSQRWAFPAEVSLWVERAESGKACGDSMAGHHRDEGSCGEERHGG